MCCAHARGAGWEKAERRVWPANVPCWEGNGKKGEWHANKVSERDGGGCSPPLCPKSLGGGGGGWGEVGQSKQTALSQKCLGYNEGKVCVQVGR